jgi:hypothetical protein
MEDFDLNIKDLDEPISINVGNDAYSNSIPGIEFLMNDKKKNNGAMNVSLDEIDNLENELNNLSSSTATTSKNQQKKTDNFFSFFGGENKTETAANENAASGGGGGGSDSFLGKATKNSYEPQQSTWDGYKKMPEIPFSENKNLDDREKKRKKRLMIKKLEELYEKKIIKSISNYTMDSSFEEIEDEYEMAMEDKRKKDSIKLQGWWFQTVINSLEYANTAINPFDLNLDGWGEQVAEDIDSYDEIFSELHEKYKGGKMAPELSLLLRIGFSAAIVNFTNKALSTATPGFNDVIKQSPELMKMFSNATVASMKNSSPAFEFASNLMNKPNEVKTTFGPPPAPIKTRNDAPPSRNEAEFSNRPDINMARGSTMFREKGVDLNNNHSFVEEKRNQPPPPPTQMAYQPFSTMPPMSVGSHQHHQQQQPIQRKEMQGPKNTDIAENSINEILSGLKTKTVIESTVENLENEINGNDSMISISSLKDLNYSIPSSSSKKTRRRKNGSEKNIVSLDI